MSYLDNFLDQLSLNHTINNLSFYQKIKKRSFSLSIILFSVLYLNTNQSFSQSNNPPATGSCGSLHIALLVDESGSITGSEITDMKDGLIQI